MGRPQLYHTPEEKKTAERKRKARYYERHRKRICQQARARYHKGEDPGSGEEVAFGRNGKDRPRKGGVKAHERNTLEILSADAHAIGTKLTKMLSGSSSAYVASIYNQSIPTPSSDTFSMDVISNSLANLNEMQRTVAKLLDGILQLDGVGNVWQAADETSRRVKQVVILLEDIYCHALLGASVLIDMYSKGELLFQK